jgi:hypothetical protein
MRKTRRSVVLGTTALSAVLLGAGLMAPAAFAGSDNYIQFENKGAFLVDTCYKWKDQGNADYCHQNRPVGQTWRAYFPADATGVTVDVHVIGGNKETLNINDVNVNHCYRTDGDLLSQHVLKVSC